MRHQKAGCGGQLNHWESGTHDFYLCGKCGKSWMKRKRRSVEEQAWSTQRRRTTEKGSGMDEQVILDKMSVLDEMLDKYAEGRLDGMEPFQYDLLLRRAVIALDNR